MVASLLLNTYKMILILKNVHFQPELSFNQKKCKTLKFGKNVENLLIKVYFFEKNAFIFL